MAEDRKQVATVINGREYRARDGYFMMTDRDAKIHRASANVPTPAASGPVGRSEGFRCRDCGFGSFFITCSRCGQQCEREE